MAETLSKFGVPLGSGQGRGRLLQPKQSHKGRVRFVGFGPYAGGIELSTELVSIGRPSPTFDVVTIHSYNSLANFTGKYSWNEIEAVFRDDNTNAVSKLIGHQLQKQFNFKEQTSPLAGINYKFTAYIESMDGGNDTVLDQWVLEGCFITSASYPQLNYEDSGYNSISINIKYDNAYMSDGLFTDTPELIPGITL